MEVEFADALRRAPRGLEREAEARGEPVDGQRLGVLKLDALRPARGDGEDPCGEGGAPAPLVVLLQQAGVNLLLFDGGVNALGAPLLHHHAGDARVAVPDGEVRHGRARREVEQVLAFEGLRRVAVENL